MAPSPFADSSGVDDMKPLIVACLLLVACASPAPVPDMPTDTQKIVIFLLDHGNRYHNTFLTGEPRESEVVLILSNNNIAMYLAITELDGKAEYRAVDFGINGILEIFTYHFNGIDMEGYDDYDEMKEALPGNILHLLRGDRV